MHNRSTKPGKDSLHPRNRHRQGYDFLQLAKTLPELAPLIIRNQYGNLTIDFADPVAVKLLNKALLCHFYQLTYWDIPANYLCPPIPGRVDYIHYLADLLAADNHGQQLRGKQIKVIDIGVGANAIYPIVGHAEYGWSFVGSDSNPVAIKAATMIAKMNPALNAALQCRLQPDPQHIFKQIIQPDEYYALTLCNPPFYSSAEQAEQHNRRKVNNLAKASSSPRPPAVRNFAGQASELWCQGGESEFIRHMIVESKQYARQCLWFSSLVANQIALNQLTRQLVTIGACEVKIIPMAQGQKVSRILVWTFIPPPQRRPFLIKQRMVSLR